MKIVTDIFRVASCEFWVLMKHVPALMVLVGGIVFYGLVYNYMYGPNVARDVPVAVVDESSTSLSRCYVRLLDATPQVKVTFASPDFLEARRVMRKEEVQGIIFLPADFDMKVGRGEEAVFAVYSSTGAFIYYGNIAEATSGAMLALNEEIRGGHSEESTVKVIGTLLYNVTGGYATFIIPAVLMVIIFQTMWMVIGMICGREQEQRMQPIIRMLHGDYGWCSLMKLIVGKAFVYIGIYLCFSVFLFGFLPLIFGLPHLANSLLIVQLLVPYLLATAFFSLACSLWFTDCDMPMLFIAFLSVPLIFLSGVSYPLQLMPTFWQWVHCLLPAPVGVLAYVKSVSLGASLPDISREVILLWMQAAVYFVLSCMAYRKKIVHLRPI